MRHYTQEEKRQWLAEWKLSGESASSFSKGRPFSANSLRYWKNKEEKSSVPMSNFIEVVSSSNRNGRNYAFTFPSGIILEMDQLPPIEELKAIVGC